MNLVWKLLRQHVSVPQFAGFFFANLFGMLIVLLGYQFYRDVIPVFTSDDSFMKSDYLIVNKKIGAASAFSGRSNAFSAGEIDDLRAQPFAKTVGKFTSIEYKAEATMGVNGQQVLNSEISFESIPDTFVESKGDLWHWKEGDDVVPVILPRTYITMYNFGFAQSHSLPKLSEGLMGMIDMKIFVHGNGRRGEFKGRVIGFSNRLSSILVPQSFMDWSNRLYAPNEHSDPTRLIISVGNPANQDITKYLDSKRYEVEDDKLDAEKTTYFLRMTVTMVMAVGLVISLLSFYILMLSIYLLVQKNSSKLETLLLIGYSPGRVARPYELLTIGLNLLVLLITLVALFFIRGYYMDVIITLFPEIDDGSMLPALSLGLCLFVLVSCMNVLAIRHKIVNIWKRKE
ncbi:MAG: ABC transporter permease [Prevotella sp.]|nr:ABC transporter permease [Bacteroidales bacterium]MDY4229701.1 ABC transporter permease [Prevotella sp.]